MPKVVVREKETIEDALRRFKRDVSRSGNLQEAKKRQYYLKPSDVRKQKKQEAERQKKYSDYLAEKRNKIINIRNNQLQILTENYPDPKDLQSIVLNRKRNLWERQINSEDFLNVRLGIGTVPLKLQLSYSMEDFSMVEDNLKDELNRLTESAKDIPLCPVTIDLAERNKLVLIGETVYKETMLSIKNRTLNNQKFLMNKEF